MSRKGDAAAMLALDLLAAGLEPEREYRFDPKRRWRFDFAFPDHKLAIEVDGGTWTGGRHTSGTGYAGDCEKVNAAVLQGWRVLRFTSNMIHDGALGVIEAAIRRDE